jgi:hypothetical protein
MIRTTTLLFTAALTSVASAQDWTVGEPVNMLLYTQTFYGGCNPNADYTWTFPTSPVTGVDYLVKITAMDPPNGVVAIVPGLPDGGLGDELVFNTTVQRTVTFGNSTTSAVLEFRAQGTPTTAGQTHPCSASPFWISNLMLCPEGLIPNVNDGCTVQGGATSVSCYALSKPGLQWPTTPNGQRLLISLPSFETATVRIVDVSGRLMLSRKMGENAALDLSGFTEGAYVLDLVRSTGSVITKRFMISRQ